MAPLSSDEDYALEEWQRFHKAVAVAKMDLRCAYRDAWFRGESDSNALLPSLYRPRHHFTIVAAEAELLLKQEQQAREAVERLRDLRGELQQRIRAEANAHGNPPKLLRKEYAELADRIRAAEGELDAIGRSYDRACRTHGTPMTKREREMFEFYRVYSGTDHRSSWQTLTEMRHFGVKTRLLDWTPALDIALFFALEDVRTLLSKSRVDSFDEGFRVLKRAYGLPTSTPIEFLDAELAARREDVARGKKVREEDARDDDAQEDSGPRVWREPRVWVLNPYHVAQEEMVRRQELDGDDYVGVQAATQKLPRIYEVSIDESLDYYRAFLHEAPSSSRWPFYWPIPIHTPWKRERLAAQQAMYIVYGTTIRPLEEMYSSRALLPLTINAAVALYGVYHLRSQRIDRYAIYRDLDGLADRISELYG